MWQFPQNLSKTVCTSPIMPTEEEEQNASDDTRTYRAYFTTIPPMEPQRLVLVGELPDQTQIPEKMQQCLGNILKIEYHEGIEFENQEQQKSPTLSNTSKITATNINKKHYRKVRQLLHQLVSNLPVFESTICSNTSVARSVIHQSGALRSTRRGSKLLNPKKSRGSCSIAVQARYESNCSEDSVDNNMMDKDDWMGGVRALRDSHVRLVQRQLRHIERLNRALDRVTRTGPNKKTAKQVHV